MNLPVIQIDGTVNEDVVDDAGEVGGGGTTSSVVVAAAVDIMLCSS